jgi:hypothetical protein
MLPKVSSAVTIRSKIWRGAKLVKDATKKLYFSDGIKKLLKRWNPCFEVEGDYVKESY